MIKAETYVALPINDNHRDPFDRMLIAQAMNRSYDIVSADNKFDQYSIKRIWNSQSPDS